MIINYRISNETRGGEGWGEVGRGGEERVTQHECG